MIAELLGTIIAFLFNIFPSGSLEGLSTAIDGIVKYLKAGLYFLPVTTMSRIFSVILVFWTYRLIIRILRTIWDLLPVVC